MCPAAKRTMIPRTVDVFNVRGRGDLKYDSACWGAGAYMLVCPKVEWCVWGSPVLCQPHHRHLTTGQHSSSHTEEKVSIMSAICQSTFASEVVLHR
jgi:hypothetical protein